MSQKGGAPAGVPLGDGAPRADGLPAPNRRLHFVHPGQVHASRTPCAISTVLGSCVAVCLWDPRGQIGGLNHFVLPYHSANTLQLEARFANVAMQRLLAEVLDLGATRERLCAKVFGGACVLPSLAKRAGGLGTSNVEAARRLLGELRIPIVAEDVGGERGRRLIFYTDDGAAFVRLL